MRSLPPFSRFHPPLQQHRASMATYVIPGQPLAATTGAGATLQAGPGTYLRGGQLYAALVGEMTREGGVRSLSTTFTSRSSRSYPRRSFPSKAKPTPLRFPSRIPSSVLSSSPLALLLTLRPPSGYRYSNAHHPTLGDPLPPHCRWPAVSS